MLFITVIAIGSVGQVLLKYGLVNGGGLSFPFSIVSLLKLPLAIINNIWILGGLSLYAIGFILWLFVLQHHELSFAFPVVGVIYIVVMFLSWLIFKENITLFRLVGTLLIASGAAVIVLGK